jgi:hypothetical protein
MLRRTAERTNTAVRGNRPFNDEGVHSNPVVEQRATFREIVEARVSRRGFLKGASVLAIGAAAARIGTSPASASSSSLTFKELSHGNDERFHVAEGYDQTVLIRWGDPVEGGAPPFDPMRQTVGAQLKQFGYNNEQRLHRLSPAPGRVEELGPRAAGGQPRVHQHRSDVPGTAREGLQRHADP